MLKQMEYIFAVNFGTLSNNSYPISVNGAPRDAVEQEGQPRKG